MTKKNPRIAVIGGGLGGIAAASLLQQSGYNVRVYEQTRDFGRIGAGIHLGPNVVRVLDRMGVAKKLIETGVQPEAWVSKVWNTGEELFTFPLRGYSERVYGAPYLTVHRGDLQDLMIESLTPGSISAGKKLVSLSERTDHVQLNFEDGSSDSADLVVGADGLRSKVRDHMLGPEEPIFTGVIGHRALFPTRLVRNLIAGDYARWWKEDRNFITYFLHQNREEIYIVTGAPQKEWKFQSSWAPCTKQELIADFEGFHDHVMRIIDAMPEEVLTKWAYFEREPLPYWAAGRLVLLGDACHPMKPHMGQGAAMAMEDAAMLVRCIDHVGVENYERGFKLYEANRHPRATKIQITSRSIAWLKDGKDPFWVYGYDVFSEPIREVENVS